jgi:hypothetical protein
MPSGYTSMPNRSGAETAPPSLIGNLPPPSLPPRTITNQGAPDAKLGRRGGDSITRDGWRSCSTLVDLLMATLHRKPHYVVIELQWAIAQLGEIHLIHHPDLGRSVLKDNSKVRVFGLQEGLPKRYWEWLCWMWVSTGPWRYANERMLEIGMRTSCAGRGLNEMAEGGVHSTCVAVRRQCAGGKN